MGAVKRAARGVARKARRAPAVKAPRKVAPPPHADRKPLALPQLAKALLPGAESQRLGDGRAPGGAAEREPRVQRERAAEQVAAGTDQAAARRALGAKSI